MNEFKHTMSDLYQMQSLPLDAKIRMTIARINVWIDTFGEEGVSISFSGGKDSTVLMDIIRNQMGYKDIPAVFVDVPTQFPELREFAKTWDNVEVLKSKISFMQVCEKYGFPLISKEIAGKMHDLQIAHRNGHECYVDRQFRGEYTTKNGKKNIYNVEKYAFLTEAPFQISHKCCSAMKKEPLNAYEKKTGRKPITAQMAEESKLRTQAWCKFGCNAFEQKKPKSNPLMFWTEQDILTYIHTYNLPICSVYGEVVEDFEAMGEMPGQMHFDEFSNDIKYKTTGCKRTGCMLCGFGCHLEKPGEGRFEMLKETHPKMYGLLDVCKNNGYTFREAIEWLNEHGGFDIKL